MNHANYAQALGIKDQDRLKIAEGLSHLLADSYTVYLKTHNYHWNVTGPMFDSLHLLFERQYTELALAVDTIAERIRSLGVKAPGTYTEFGKLTQIKEDSVLPRAKDMIRNLLADQETIARSARALFPLVDQAQDEPTADLLTQRMQTHEKNAWMLRSLLEE